MKQAVRLAALAVLFLVLGPSRASAQAEDASAASETSETKTPAPEPAKREPITHIDGSAPTETLQERMARFKREKGAGSDKPFEGMAAQAEQEMEQRRRAAIGSATQAEQLEAEESVESRVAARESLQDQLAQLGAWGGSGCVEVEPAWNTQEDFIRHRKLRADDFLYQGDKRVAAVAVPKVSPSGFAAIALSCELEPQVQKTPDEQFVAHLVRVRYYAVMSRKQSWLAEHAENRESFLLGHQQLHFDMAESLAGFLNKQRAEVIASVLGTGRTPEAALGMLQLRWGEHMLAVHNDFDAIENAFDRDTKHGTLTEKQTEWVFRLGNGFDALTKGIRLETRAAKRSSRK